MRNIRNTKRTEEKWLSREATQRCSICGKRFAMRAEKICSRECLQKLKEQAKQKTS